MTSWQTRPAAGEAVVGTDRQGSSPTHELDKIFDKYVCRENSQLFFFTKDQGHWQLQKAVLDVGLTVLQLLQEKEKFHLFMLNIMLTL